MIKTFQVKNECNGNTTIKAKKSVSITDKTKAVIAELLKFVNTHTQKARPVLDFPSKVLDQALDFLSLEERLVQKKVARIYECCAHSTIKHNPHHLGGATTRDTSSKCIYLRDVLSNMGTYLYDTTHTLLNLGSGNGLSKLYQDNILYDKNNKFMAEEVTADEVPVKEIRDRLNHIRRTGCVYVDSFTKTYGGIDIYIPWAMNIVLIGNSPYNPVVRRL